MTRVLSGVVLGAVALALIWFLSASALLGVALAVAALAFTEYEKIVDAIGARVPFWTALLATLLACAMVPFQWVDIESVLAAALLLVAFNVLMSDRVGTPLLADTTAAVLAPIYIGLPLGSLVGVHAMAGREAVLLLIATVAVSDTAQFYAARRSAAHRWRRCAVPRRRARAPSAALSSRRSSWRWPVRTGCRSPRRGGWRPSVSAS
jgi:CDP-diglyceride synthetase